MNRYAKTGIFISINIVLIYLLVTNFSSYEQEFSLNKLALNPGEDHENKTYIKLNNKEEKTAPGESYIESMKNLILNKIGPGLNVKNDTFKINKEVTTIDTALAEALTDSSEIDLSPPNPVLGTHEGRKNISSLVSCSQIIIITLCFIIFKVEFKEVMLSRRELVKNKCVRRKSRQILNNRVFYSLPVII